MNLKTFKLVRNCCFSLPSSSQKNYLIFSKNDLWNVLGTSIRTCPTKTGPNVKADNIPIIDNSGILAVNSDNHLNASLDNAKAFSFGKVLVWLISAVLSKARHCISLARSFSSCPTQNRTSPSSSGFHDENPIGIYHLVLSHLFYYLVLSHLFYSTICFHWEAHHGFKSY